MALGVSGTQDHCCGLTEEGKGYPTAEMAGVLRFKEILRQLEHVQSIKCNAEDVWDTNIVAWMTSSLDCCVASSDLHGAIEKFNGERKADSFDLCLKAAKWIYNLVAEMTKYEEDFLTQTLGAESQDPLVMLCNFGWTSKAGDCFKQRSLLISLPCRQSPCRDL